MPENLWWTTVSPDQVLHLRTRLAAYVRTRFGTTLQAEVEDVVQHAFVVLLRQRESVNPASDGLFRYLKTVAHNEALDRLKSARTQLKHLPEVIAERDRQSGPDAPLGMAPEEWPEERRKIWKIFCALDELDRLILWKHAVDGQSVRAIARDLGLNWHRVALAIERALRKARRQLGS